MCWNFQNKSALPVQCQDRFIFSVFFCIDFRIDFLMVFGAVWTPKWLPKIMKNAIKSLKNTFETQACFLKVFGVTFSHFRGGFGEARTLDFDDPYGVF